MTRPRLRIHLSTAVLLMLASGILLGLNVCGRPYTYICNYRFDTGHVIPEFKELPRNGWPLPNQKLIHASSLLFVTPESGINVGGEGTLSLPIELPAGLKFNPENFAWNIVINLAILGLTAIISELTIRKNKPLPAKAGSEI